ncbi:MAG: hypothetical protein ACFFB0_02790 [Promethearchaeota archaeon]
MCEFKIIRKNDGSQILEDIVILSYNEENELILKDVIGMGEILESALILEVNTMNQKCNIIEHPIIKDFINLVNKLSNKSATKSNIDEVVRKLEALKQDL